jgi:hypothetical protein
MIKSRHNTLGFWLFAGGIMFFSFLAVCAITQYYFNLTIVKVDVHSHRAFNAQLIAFLIACLIFGTFLSFRASSIEINSQGILKTIAFKNLFTRKTKVFPFQQFDGYITTKLWHRQFNENKTLCLIKQGRIVKKIDNFIYSNIDELQEGLKHMPYLGFKEMGIVNSWKVLFDQPIL